MTQEILELRNKGMPLHLRFQQQTTTTLAITRWLRPASPDRFRPPRLRALILLLPWHGSLRPRRSRRECLCPRPPAPFQCPRRIALRHTVRRRRRGRPFSHRLVKYQFLLRINRNWPRQGKHPCHCPLLLFHRPRPRSRGRHHSFLLRALRGRLVLNTPNKIFGSLGRPKRSLKCRMRSSFHHPLYSHLHASPPSHLLPLPLRDAEVSNLAGIQTRGTPTKRGAPRDSMLRLHLLLSHVLSRHHRRNECRRLSCLSRKYWMRTLAVRTSYTTVSSAHCVPADPHCRPNRPTIPHAKVAQHIDNPSIPTTL